MIKPTKMMTRDEILKLLKERLNEAEKLEARCMFSSEPSVIERGKEYTAIYIELKNILDLIYNGSTYRR